MLKHVFYSVMHNKCPKCHQGNVFVSNKPYNLREFDKMEAACPVCGEVYEKEPGYFYGAMYVSYALMVGFFVITWAINSFLVGAGAIPYLVFLSLTIVILSPLTFRISRLLWLNFFISYNNMHPHTKKS